jgi:hypothetical protein
VRAEFANAALFCADAANTFASIRVRERLMETRRQRVNDAAGVCEVQPAIGDCRAPWRSGLKRRSSERIFGLLGASRLSTSPRDQR